LVQRYYICNKGSKFSRQKGSDVLMKKLLVIATAFGLFMMPFVVYSQSEQTTVQAPAIEQTLVPEGDFAMKLVVSLKMGTTETEAQAEDILSSVGIAPRNGWIADYPVTPDIVGELQKAVMAAADSNKLPMGSEEALKAFNDVAAEFGLNVVADTSGSYSENQPPTGPEYVQPTVINNYYYEEGPPVVTYYPPPWDYYYLYAWVPSPFWCSGFFFPGFFILHDFHRTVFFGHRTVVVTNHLFDHRTRRVVVIDPVRRMRGSRTWVTSGISPKRESNVETRKGAASIFERSRERVRFGNTMPRTTGRGVTGNIAPPGSQNRSEERVLRNRGNSAGRSETGAFSGGRNSRTFNQPGNIERRNDMNVQRPSGGQGRSFTPNVTHERSFSVPSTGSRSFGSSGNSGRTFSAPSRSFSPPSTESRGSFGRSRAGDGGRSFGNGGFAWGGGRGGCRGRC
jgi:hypothetical protein